MVRHLLATVAVAATVGTGLSAGAAMGSPTEPPRPAEPPSSGIQDALSGWETEAEYYQMR